MARIIARCLVINSTCNSPSALTLSRSPSTKDQRASPPPLIQVSNNIGEAECEGFELVDQQLADQFTWEQLPQMTTESDTLNPDSACWNDQKTGSPGISASYQCQGIASCLSSPTDLRREQGRNSCSPENRQYDCSVLYRLDGWYPLQKADGNHIADLELELGQENFPVSQTSSRYPKCGCRSGIMEKTGQFRMEAGPINNSTNHANSGSLSSVSFCFQDISSTSSI